MKGVLIDGKEGRWEGKLSRGKREERKKEVKRGRYVKEKVGC